MQIGGGFAGTINHSSPRPCCDWESGAPLPALPRTAVREISLQRSCHVDGMPAVRLNPPVPGNKNEGLYSYERNGERRLLKILSWDCSTPSHGLIEALQGMKLGAQVGGPMVFEYGRIHDDYARRGWFVEMEHIFHGLESVTLKELLLPGGDVKRLLEWGCVPRMAALIVGALARGVSPFDIDFIAAREGVRFIDTQWFKRWEERANGHACWASVFNTLGKLDQREPEVARRLMLEIEQLWILADVSLRQIEGSAQVVNAMSLQFAGFGPRRR